jgi:hypothetical protein
MIAIGLVEIPPGSSNLSCKKCWSVGIPAWLPTESLLWIGRGRLLGENFIGPPGTAQSISVD